MPDDPWTSKDVYCGEWKKAPQIHPTKPILVLGGREGAFPVAPSPILPRICGVAHHVNLPSPHGGAAHRVLAWQVGMMPNQDSPCPYVDQINFQFVPAGEARGPVEARARAQVLRPKGMEFCLQVDAHVLLAPAWDQRSAPRCWWYPP